MFLRNLPMGGIGIVEERRMFEVLIVVRSAAFLQRIALSLVSSGFSVDIASTRQVAVRKMRKRHYDLLVMDAVVPGSKKESSFCRSVEMQGLGVGLLVVSRSRSRIVSALCAIEKPVVWLPRHTDTTVISQCVRGMVLRLQRPSAGEVGV